MSFPQKAKQEKEEYPHINTPHCFGIMTPPPNDAIILPGIKVPDQVESLQTYSLTQGTEPTMPKHHIAREQIQEVTFTASYSPPLTDKFVFPKSQDEDAKRSLTPPLYRPRTVYSRSRVQRTKSKTTLSTKRKKPIKKDQGCLFCGIKESPEWRKGPCGGLSLCNACGLNYAKNLKREKMIAPSPERNFSLSLILNAEEKTQPTD